VRCRPHLHPRSHKDIKNEPDHATQLDREPVPDGGGRSAHVRARGGREEAVRAGPQEVGHGVRRVISKNPSPDRKFTDPTPQSTCTCMLIMNSQDRIRQSTIHHISNFSSPDQKFSKHNHDHMHVHNHNRFSGSESIVHSTYKVKFFQPGSKIRRHPTKP